jgi:hypothetical protein
MLEPLLHALTTRQLILFVGAGVSRSLGLPSWAELIDHIASELNYDPRVFARNGSYLELAEYYELQKTTLGPLRSWMDRKWHANESRVKASAVHNAILDLDCPIIYTTNYDRWLELAHSHRSRDFTKVANVGDFTKIRDGTTQIVKLHGDFDDDQSLVLTETSYFDRLSFDSPLDIKLRSDAIGRSILFVGYSLSDINVRYLLYRLYRMWADSPYASARPKSYLFLSRPNSVQEAILEARGIVPVVSSSDDPAKGLQEFLEGLVSAMEGT